MEKPKLGVFYWHNPTRLGNLELVNNLRQEFDITLISNEEVPWISRYGDNLITEHFGQTTEIIRKLKLHKAKNGLDGLITLSEGAVTLLADATSELNLRGNDPASTRAGRNKYLMRTILSEKGIPQPEFYKASTLEEALDIATTHFHNTTFFLKPPCIGGSSFCAKIDSIEELQTYWNEFFEGSKVRTSKDPLFTEQFGKEGNDYYMLIEELMTGTQFDYDDILGPLFPIFEMSVEGFIDGDTTYVYSMTDKLLPKDCKNAEEYIWRMHSRIPSKLKEVLVDRVKTINRTLNATSGCSHTEFRIEDANIDEADIELDGKFYRARLIETALRPGGAFMQSVIELATGYNSIRAMAYQACNMPHQEDVLYRRPTIMANLWATESGKLKHIEGLDKILSLKEQIPAFHLYDGVGDNVLVPPEASRGIADAVVFGKNVDLLKIPEWEIKSGNDNVYKEAEKTYLYIVDKFKAVTKK
ncbi:MAG: hypothetical protein U9Q69_03530 [Nanoarchaeota archaeon]|nr:hypothetical protein [Nanoarchaeota archaeon]